MGSQSPDKIYRTFRGNFSRSRFILLVDVNLPATFDARISDEEKRNQVSLMDRHADRWIHGEEGLKSSRVGEVFLQLSNSNRAHGRRGADKSPNYSGAQHSTDSPQIHVYFART